MHAYAASYSRYIIAISLAVYAAAALFRVFVRRRPARAVPEAVERLMIPWITLNGYLTIGLLQGELPVMFLFWSLQTVLLQLYISLYRHSFPDSDGQILLHAVLLLSVGLMMIARIDIRSAVKQAGIAAAGLFIVFLLVQVRTRLYAMRSVPFVWGALGILLLGTVLILGSDILGARLSYEIAGMSFQPSEFVKILYPVFLAGALGSADLKGWKILACAAAAAVHVGLLILSTDLGGALIYYMVFLLVLYLATGKGRYVLVGLGAGAAGAAICFFLFEHIRIRVQIFLDPFAYIDGSGYQIVQSLFAISFGGLWGAGLAQGAPQKIPFVMMDFIFAAITEEMGLIAAGCVLAVCLLLFLELVLLSGESVEYYQDRFLELFLFGTGITFIFQTFLTVGGETRFIPLTGVTLPLVSYGGSSVLATILLLGIADAGAMLIGERRRHFLARYAEESARPVYEEMPGREERLRRDRRYQRQPAQQPRQPQQRPARRQPDVVFEDPGAYDLDRAGSDFRKYMDL